MSARVRRSVNSLERSANRVSARWASSPMGSRDGAVAQPATRSSTRAMRELLRGFGATLDPALAVLEVVHLLLDPVGGRIELQSLLPRGERIVVEPVLHDRVIEAGLLLVNHAQLEVEVLLLVVEGQALLERLD